MNPLSLEVLENLPLGTFEEDVKQITDEITAERDGRAKWSDNIRKVRELIDGTQERKNLPWKNASQVCVPLIKRQIRRWAPLLYNLYALADPLCSFQATTYEGMQYAETAERFFDWLVKTYMDDSNSQIQYLTNYIGGDGSGYLGTFWDYRTETVSRVMSVDNVFPGGIPEKPMEIIKPLVQQYELNLLNENTKRMVIEAVKKIRQGHKFIRLTYEKVVKNKPKLMAFDATQVISPASSDAAHEAEWLAVEHQMSANEIRQKTKDGFFLPEQVNKLFSYVQKNEEKPPSNVATTTTADAAYNREHRLRDAGIYTMDDQYTIYQVFCKVDWNNDGVKEKTVMWYCDEAGSPFVLAMYPYSYSLAHWPLFRFDYEKVFPGPYGSQGMGGMLKPLQEQLNKQYRAKSDAIDIQLAPVFQNRVSSGLRNRNIVWGPGKIIDVMEIGDIAPVEKNTFNLHEYLNAEAQIETYADTLVGSLVNDLQATGKKLERRTATEVGRVAQTSEAMQSMDSASFQSTMRLVWQSVWQLWLDFGPREIYFWVTKKKTPELFKKADYDKNFQLMPTGTPGNTDKQKQLSSTMELLNIALNDPTRSFNIPLLGQRVATLIDDRLADVVLLPQAQQMAMQALEQAAQLIQAGELPPDVQHMMSSGASRIENQG